MKKNQKSFLLKKALSYSGIGIEMGMAIAFGYFLGRFFDKKLLTSPYLSITFLILGIICAFWIMIKRVKKAMKTEKE